MSTNADLITSFYEAFQLGDHEAMNACYHQSIRFSDPVFEDLDAGMAKAMWHMLCEHGDDLVVTFSGVRATEERGHAHWEATYTFGRSSKQVHNVVEAEFLFRDGLIYRHRDSFDLWRWSRMALGYPGTLLGWSGPLKNKVRDRARRQLDRFMSEHPEHDA